MKSVKYFGKGEVRVVDVAEPQLVRPDDVKIKISYCGICGSDLHTKRGEMDFMFNLEHGSDLGHEASGTIVELGPEATKKGLHLGDRVTYYFNTHCGSCYYCRNGQEQFCQNIVGHYNAMSEYLVVPEQSVYKLPDDLDLKKGTLVEPISVVLHGIDMANIRPGSRVAISGGGTMGMLFTQLCLKAGATDLTVIEPIAMKREKALQLGAKHVIDPVAQDRKAAAMEITNGLGYDVVIEASGSWRACDGIEELVSRGGTLEFFAALYKSDYDYKLNLMKAFMQEVHIVGGVMQSPYMFPRSIALAKELNLDAFLTENCVFSAEHAEEAFQAQMDGTTVKSLIAF